MANNTSVASAATYLRNRGARPKLDTSNPFGFITDEKYIRNTLNKATKAAYDVRMKEANLGMNRAENTSYANTANAIKSLREQLVGSASSGANVGAANATALQALLGTTEQNSQAVTDALNSIYGIAGERQASMMQNAADAISSSNAAKNQQGSLAAEQYNADATMAAEALAAYGALIGTRDTNRTNDSMNRATNAANKAIARLQAKSNEKISKTTNKQDITYHNN